MMEVSKVVKMGYVIQEYLQKHKWVDAKPKHLMPILIEKGFFTTDHREGLPLRNVLRDLDAEGLLYLLPQVSVERKSTKRLWFFNPVKI